MGETISHSRVTASLFGTDLFGEQFVEALMIISSSNHFAIILIYRRVVVVVTVSNSGAKKNA
jgi:hypothetical protein